MLLLKKYQAFSCELQNFRTISLLQSTLKLSTTNQGVHTRKKQLLLRNKIGALCVITTTILAAKSFVAEQK